MTHDQIDRMVRQANPVPDLTALEPVDASVLMLNQQRRMEMDTQDRVQVDQQHERPRQRLLIGIAAAVVVAVGALILLRPTDEAPVADDQPAVTEAPAPTTVVTEAPSPPTASATEIATAFVEAYGSFDIDRALSYLAADATLPSLGDAEGLRLNNRLWEAQGFKLVSDPCEEVTSSPSRTLLTCPFNYHALRSDEIGLGPYTGSRFHFTVEEGEITTASIQLEYISNGFSAEMWEPFAAWVSETYPDDVAIMYTDSSLSLESLTEESIQLWEQRSREYAEFVAQQSG